MKTTSSFPATVTGVFAFLGILFIPFPFALISFQQSFTDIIFGRLIGMTARLFGHSLRDTRVYSDSISMYILLLLLFVLALLLTLAASKLNWWKNNGGKLMGIIYTVCCYYLLLQLMKYGVGKIFKTQFYLPEPNTLYTPLGKISKDLLFWSSVGTSYSYNVITGSVEVIAALLLLFRRTRLAGLLLAAMVLLQIIIINFCFDISVKLFSLFLFYLCIYLLSPYFNRLYQFLFLSRNEMAVPGIPRLSFTQSFWRVFLKCLVSGVILVEVLYPSIMDHNFNDDRAARPYLHGAYEVRQVLKGTDTLPKNDWPVKRFFIHRNGYIIFQDRQDNMQDYKLSYDLSANKMILEDYQLKKVSVPYHYSGSDSVLTLQLTKDSVLLSISGRALDWRQLPALKKEFHWTIDAE